jgi:hypothetical protein
VLQLAATTKKKEEDVVAMAHAIVAAVQGGQEAILIAMATTRKTLDKAHAAKCAFTLAWEKENTNTCHLEQQLAATQGIVIPQDNDDDRSIDTSSNPNAALVTLLQAQAIDIQTIRSVVRIILKPLSPHYKRWRDLVFHMLRRYALDDHVLFGVTDAPTCWARLDNIVVTWILSTLSAKSTRLFGK